MHALEELLLSRLKEGLTRKSIVTCSRWAEQYRVIPSFGSTKTEERWSFKYFPWLRGMHDSRAVMNIGQKGAQVGYSEAMLNIILFNMDIRMIDCLYVLPTQKPDASDFTASRLSPAIESSPHVNRMFSDTSNIGHKKAGNVNLYIRGSRSRSHLKSIPAGIIVIDEKDEMVQKNVPLAFERASGQSSFQIWQVSTPFTPGFGINADFLTSSQNHYHFRCPHCSRYTELIYPECFVLTGDDENDPNLKQSHYVCKECKIKLDHENKWEWLAEPRAEWVSAYPGRDAAGWHVNQLYSSAERCNPYNFAISVIKARTDPAAEQELWNSKLGLPHMPEGASVSDTDIDECKKAYRTWKHRESNRVLTMGIDVGNYLHYTVREWLIPNATVVDLSTHARPRLVAYGKVLTFEAIEEILDRFTPHFSVIDSQPERRKAIELANKYYGRMRVCSYERGIEGKALHTMVDEPRVKVDRTSWLDLTLGRYIHRNIDLPADLSLEFRNHIKAQVRMVTNNAEGNPEARYITPAGEDHYAHADNYAEIALPFATATGKVKTITRRV